MWRFRKSFSPLPGVRLTLSPSGISTSVGVGPFRVTAGPRGSRFTTNVLGTGLSYQQPLSGRRAPQPTESHVEVPNEPLATLVDPRVEHIQSAGSAVLTTPGLAEFRRLLERARIEHAETAREFASSQDAERAAVSRYESWKSGWLLRRLMKSKFAELGSVAEEATAKRVELEEQEALARLNTQIEVPSGVKAAYARMVDAFAQLARSKHIWDTVSHRAINQFVERSNATRAIERQPVKFRLGRCQVIESEWQVPNLGNANGGDLFLFPLFVVYFAGEQAFALLEYKELQFVAGLTAFQEEEEVPNDTKVIGQTWAKVNKDGSPDRRFKDNYSIPIAQYGRLTFASATGLNEEYMVSNYDASQAFASEWASLVRAIKRGT